MKPPQPNADSAPFWAATAEQRLLFQRCERCSRPQFPPRAECLACGGALRWEDACKGGLIHSFTVVRRAPSAEFKSRVPYVIALVELDEGPRLMLNVVDGVDHPALAIGARVRVVFEVSDRPEHGRLPQALMDEDGPVGP